MSEATLGVIVGGVIGFIAGTIAAIVQGHYSMSRTRMELEHKEKENRTNRRIDIISVYLKPLREQVMGCHRLVLEAIGKIKIINLKQGGNRMDTVSGHLKSEVNTLEKKVDKTREEVAKLITLNESVTDKTLNKLIDGIAIGCTDARKTMNSIKTAIEAGSKNRQSSANFPKDDFDSLLSTLERTSKHFKYVDRRIQGLLSGEE